MKDIEIQPGMVIPANELTVAVARSSGPGGQNVNKVSSKVTLKWKFDTSDILAADIVERMRSIARSHVVDDAYIQVSSQEHRDQPANFRACELKLRRLVLQSLQPPKIRRATRPTASSNRRRLDDKAKRGQSKALRQRRTWD